MQTIFPYLKNSFSNFSFKLYKIEFISLKFRISDSDYGIFVVLRQTRKGEEKTRGSNRFFFPPKLPIWLAHYVYKGTCARTCMYEHKHIQEQL